MTPGARVAAAIAVLDRIIGGAVAEQALSQWARGSRFAGSKDRAAVRDHVFDVLRAKRSLGDGKGRQLMIALVARDNLDIDALFSGDGHAPAPVQPEEKQALRETSAATVAAQCDIPDWLWPQWQESLGAKANAVATAQQGRAPVFLRVNQRKGRVAAAIERLAEDGIVAEAHGFVRGCLRVTENARRVKTSAAYQDGFVELQDAASQAAVQRVTVPAGGRVLDYCAGGGGKALAFAALHDGPVLAHDIAPQRMRDLPVRAARAGVEIPTVETRALAAKAPFDVVFCDAPCSGSGTWRRTPEAKWRLTQSALDDLGHAQAEVLANAAPLVAPQGQLVYATCSVLACENAKVVEQFCAVNPAWRIAESHQGLPDGDGDGFFSCSLVKQDTT